MLTVDFLRQEAHRLFEEGCAVIEQQWQIAHETSSDEIRDGAWLLWDDGLHMCKQSNALWKVIAMYQAQERAYLFLCRKMGKLPFTF